MSLHDRGRTYEKHVDRVEVPLKARSATDTFRRKFLGSPERAAVYLGTHSAYAARRLPSVGEPLVPPRAPSSRA